METIGTALAIRRVPLDALHLDPLNVRVHGDENLAAIEASLRRFNQAEPLVVQAGTGRVIGGNGRLVAMRKLGWTHCDVVELALDDLSARALGAALNRTAELASYDEKGLLALLQELESQGALEGTGFSAKDLDDLVAQLSTEIPAVDQDQVPGLPDKATTRPGDLWVIGRHRLLCADSAKPEDVDRLLAGAKIQLANCDCPYNVKVEPRSNNAIAAGLSSFTQTHHQKLDLSRHPEKSSPTTAKLRPKDRPLENDFVSDEEFERLLRAWFGNIARVLEPGRAFYIWGGYANCGNYPPVLKECELYFSQSIIWDKQHPVLTRKDFMGAHEWCFYGWKLGAAHQYFGPANATDLWAVKKVNPQSMIHLTEKPVELAARAIAYSSRTGENVLDLFGGSGSTMAACEQMGRTAYLMELDTLYCDVIVERMQKLTGKDAVLESGETFAQRRECG